MDGGKADDAGVNIRVLIFALLALACGHMLSTLLRTIPAISLDVMAADFGTSPQKLASLTSIYHFAFAASQIPVGAAMDRFGVRPVSLSLLLGTSRMFIAGFERQPPFDPTWSPLRRDAQRNLLGRPSGRWGDPVKSRRPDISTATRCR